MRKRIGRTWICTARGEEPLPVSISYCVRSPLVLQRPRPFNPAFGHRFSRPDPWRRSSSDKGSGHDELAILQHDEAVA